MSKRPQILTLPDIRTMPQQGWAVQNVFPPFCLASIFGPSGAAKSILVIDFAAHMLLAIPWFGYKIPKPLKVTMIMLEGQSGFIRRTDAWAKKNGRDYPDGIRVIFDPVQIDNEGSITATIDAIKANGGTDVIFIDTLNRAAPNSNENDPKDMNRIIALSTRLQKSTNSLVILVHHSGKDESRGLRGHSSLLAALDTVIEVKYDGNERWWRVAKSKESKAGSSHAFELCDVELGLDDFGEPITSAAIVDTGGSAPNKIAAARKLTPNQSIVRDQIIALIAEKSLNSVDSDEVGISWKELAASCKKLGGLDVAQGRKAERTKDAAKALVAAGYVNEHEGVLYLPK